MKLGKVLAIAGLATMLVAGNAFAYSGNPNNIENRKSLITQSRIMNKSMSVVRGSNSLIDIISDITGKSVEEVKELCKNLREDNQTLTDYLESNGILQEVKDKIIAQHKEKLQEALDAGKITQEQYEEKLSIITERINNNELKSFANTIRSKLMNIPFGKEISEITGKTKEELSDLSKELKTQGKTMIDYLKDNNLYEALKSSILDRFNERLDKAVESGKMTAEKAAEIKANYEQKLNEGNLFKFSGIEHKREKSAITVRFDQVLEEVTGLSSDEIAKLCLELKEQDKTLVDYLKDNNLYDSYKTAKLASVKENLDNAVASGKITQETADTMYARCEEALEKGLGLGVHMGQSKRFNFNKQNNNGQKRNMSKMEHRKF